MKKMAVRQFLPCDVECLKLGDIVYDPNSEEAFKKVVKIGMKNSEGEDVVGIVFGSRDDNKRSNSTFISSEVGFFEDKPEVVNVYSKNKQFYCLVELSDNHLKVLEGIPLLPL